MHTIRWFIGLGLMLGPVQAFGQSPDATTAAQPAASPTCAQLEAEARRAHREAEAARIAAHDNGLRYAFFFDCPLEAEAQPAPAANPAPSTGSNSFGLGSSAVPSRPPAAVTSPSIATSERCTGNALDAACEGRSVAAIGRNGEVVSERRCTQSAFGQTCESSSTFTFGDSEVSRNLARELLEESFAKD